MLRRMPLVILVILQLRVALLIGVVVAERVIAPRILVSIELGNPRRHTSEDRPKKLRSGEGGGEPASATFLPRASERLRPGTLPPPPLLPPPPPLPPLLPPLLLPYHHHSSDDRQKKSRSGEGCGEPASATFLPRASERLRPLSSETSDGLIRLQVT